MILIKNKILICCKCNKIIQGNSKNYVQEFNEYGLIGFTQRAYSRLNLIPSDSAPSDSAPSIYPYVKREV